MKKSTAAIAVMFVASAIGVPLAGCNGPRPFIRNGNADSVEIGYYGDVAGTLPLARTHCAQFERVPRLAEAALDLAVYDCLRR